MATITAADVNTLRKQTGSGMMDCKNALVEADGDFEKAVEALRKKGQKVAAKRGDKDANEGLVIAKAANGGKKGVIITLNCETDFVAKNDNFGLLANKIVEIAIQHAPSSLDNLKTLPFEGNGQTISEKIIEEVGKIGEKIELSAYEIVEGETVFAYNHPGNKVASVVGLNKSGTEELAKDVAMQIAAMSPIAIDESEVPTDVVEKEIEIGKEQAINEGKPAELAEKIAQGKLKKFYKESTLLNQDFIKDNKKSVGQYLKEADNELSVTAFKRQALV
ncbi:MAG: elongation factor Ts [Flavobacteriales bacterium]|nr:elongation factor Ts [Bacteroidales bacterium AH-315-I05]PCJ84932.1 MAG: elongation factor Ts [Flavobacteriales bacterium]